MSTQTTRCPTSARQAPVTSPTYPEPMIEMFMTCGTGFQPVVSKTWVANPCHFRSFLFCFTIAAVPDERSLQSVIQRHQRLVTKLRTRLLDDRTPPIRIVDQIIPIFA